MRPFGYWRDPLCLASIGVYLISRFFIRPYTDAVFWRGYLADLLCIPIFVPLMLWAMRRLGVRKTDETPNAAEILIPLLVWATTFEVILPLNSFFAELTFPDSLDVLCYVSGAFGATLFWERWYRRGSDAEPPPEAGATDR